MGAASDLLGQIVAVPAAYAPEVLVAIPRAHGRAALALPAGALPFVGVDVWNAYELSWLTPSGLPTAHVATFTVPAGSPCLVESKSLKLYLNSLNFETFASPAAARAVLAADLSGCVGAPVGVDFGAPPAAGAPRGQCLDRLAVRCDANTVTPELLTVGVGAPRPQALHSHLLRTLCPVTGQPDWATVHVALTGRPVDPGALLRYLVSYRRHQGFHEQCVEQIFCDLWARCAPTKLAVEARFTRRGGVDINPFRSSHPCPAPPNRRTPQQ